MRIIETQYSFRTYDSGIRKRILRLWNFSIICNMNNFIQLPIVEMDYMHK